MFKKKIYISLILLLFTSSCGDSWDAFKRGMTGQKQASTDEFLVKKKDPLVLPPRFDELPMPGQSIITEEEEITDIEQLIQLGDNQISSSSTNLDESLEESIIRQIQEQ